MKVSRRALILGAGAVGLAAALPLRRSYADPANEEYRLTAKPATVNLTGNGTRIPLSGPMTAPCPARNCGSAEASRCEWW